MDYPSTHRDGTVDIIHGREIADPYRWLEDPDSLQTSDWVAAQNALTEQYLAGLPEREWFAATMARVISRPRASTPRVLGGWTFVSRNDGTTDQDVWYVGRTLEQAAAPDARVVLDPNAWSTDQPRSLTSLAASDDGRLLSYTVNEGGSDWQRIEVIDIATGARVDDPGVWAKFTVPTWLPDHRSYLYTAFDAPPDGTDTTALGRAVLRRHVVGQAGPDEDVLVPDDDRVTLDAEVSHDDAWLIVTLTRGTENRNRLWVFPLTTDEDATSIGAVRKVVDSETAEVIPIRVAGADLLVHTDADAPLGQVVAIDLATGSRRTIVAEGTEPIAGVVAAGATLLVERLVDASPQLTRYDLAGADLGVVDLPGGAIVASDASPRRPVAYVGVSTLTAPTVSLAVDTSSGDVRDLHLTPAAAGIVPGYHLDRLHATSADGTQVPYWLVTPDHAPDAPAPTLLYGYGGFKIPVLADYRPGWPAWLAAGGRLAIANLRGGGEFGTSWYDDGRRDAKQHVFDDCIAVAEDLVARRVTTTRQLAVHGRSNGGLLVGAVMTQRPDLFAAALPAVGVLDLLRFHRFTIGWAWTSDYGDPDVAHDAEVALAYSPLHNVRPGTAYPATLIATGDHDDRVVPLHSLKFAATLQAAQAGPAPILARIEVATGHGMGKPAAMMAREWADLLAFAAHHTGLVPPEPTGDSTASA